MSIRAVARGGVFVPLEKVEIPDGQEVDVTIREDAWARLLAFGDEVGASYAPGWEFDRGSIYEDEERGLVAAGGAGS